MHKRTESYYTRAILCAPADHPDEGESARGAARRTRGRTPARRCGRRLDGGLKSSLSLVRPTLMERSRFAPVYFTVFLMTGPTLILIVDVQTIRVSIFFTVSS